MTEPQRGYRRIGRPGIAAIAVLTASLSLVSPAMPIALADANSKFGIEAQPNVEQNVPESTSALQWGIRGSFVRYVSGATNILDGAKQGPNNSYLWPYKETTKNSDTGEITVQYGGTVNFMKHCGGEPIRPNCDLDFTFSAPKVVIDTKTGAGKLLATIHTKDYLTKQWSGPSEKHIGNLDFNAGRYNIQNGKMHWKGVSATLTEEGNASFSNFYEAGGFLDSLSFTMDDTFEIGERSGYNLTNQIKTQVPSSTSNRFFVRQDGTVLNVSSNENGTVQIFTKDLSSVKKIANISINRGSMADFDPASNTLYWWNENTVHMGQVTNDGLQNITELGTFEGKVTGFAYSKTLNAVGLLHIDGPFNAQVPYFSTFDAAKKVTKTELPSASTFLPGAEDLSEFYGSTFSSGPSALRALPDGTFIFLHDVLLRPANGEAEPNIPLHISPAAADGEKVKRIQEFKPFMQGSRGSFRGLTTDGNGNIAIYSTLDRVENASGSLIGFANYNNGTFTVHPATQHPDLQGIAGVGFSPDGSAAVVSEKRSVVLLLNPTSMAETGRASLGQNMKDTSRLLNDGAVFSPDGDLYVYEQYPPGEDDWRDYIGLQRLTLPDAVQQRDNSIQQYTMAGQKADAGNSNSNDTSAEEDKLPPGSDNGTKPGNPAPGGDPQQPPATDNPKPQDSDAATQQAKEAAEEAKAAAEEAKKLAEEAKTNAAKAAEVEAAVKKAEVAAQKAEAAAKAAEEFQAAAEKDAQEARRERAEAEAAAQKAQEAREAAEQARSAAEKAQKDAEGILKQIQNEKQKPHEDPSNQEKPNNVQHWLEHRGFSSPFARIIGFFASILQALIFPFLGIFGAMR
ncbi:HtaA domain-containing protein [Corynebacterium freiburgense]|uniref:HtaA domain-containing protein n=1 Tax=Corynebacterium freiburgense TaxID=556548 RepID=UPI0003FC5565|nr:HtaA domain-containing protein [Corynebacterium freiburgense]WJZ02637.1 Htaa [Corynebacterium freiburgense]